MDVIAIARQLGNAIQQDERYTAFALASQRCEEDAELQVIIADITQKRAELGEELKKGEGRSEEVVGKLGGEMREMYAELMQSEKITAMNDANAELKKLLDFVNQIITGASQGKNPDTIEFSEGCGGGCGSCGGC